MQTTHRLEMPYIMPSQAQKHVTHNEAIRMLDALVMPVVEEAPRNDPPENASDGTAYAVDVAPTGDWANQPATLAARQDGAWFFFTPKPGWRFTIRQTWEELVFQEDDWHVVEGSFTGSQILGVNAIADETNRLSVSSPASLFNHEGNDHRLKINKATEADAASIVFQSDFSGKAEIGLVGNDSFSFKTSADGSNFTELLKLDADTEKVRSADLGINRNPSANLHVHDPDTTATIRIQSGEGGTFGSPFADLSHDGNSFFFSNWGAGNIAFTAVRPGTSVAFGAGGTTTVRVTQSAFEPEVDNATSLGASGKRWSEIWVANGVIQTSDERDKTISGSIDHAGNLVDAISPILFKWKGEAGEARLNAGFSAQQVEKTLSAEGLNWNLSGKSENAESLWIRSDQLLAVLWQALRETRQELEVFKQAL